MSTNPIVAFDFEEQAVRTIEHRGEPWFVLTDVCKILSISNPTQVAARLDEDERSMFNIGRQGEIIIINESGLYSAILRSKGAATPGTAAHRFRRWVTGEVLPSLRRQGFYGKTKTTHTIAALRDMNREIERLSNTLIHTRNPGQRRMIYAMLEDMCRQRGIEAAPLDQLGQDALAAPDILQNLWNGLDILKAHGIAFNHARSEGKLALSLPELQEKFAETGVKLLLDSAMRKALRQSEHPKFIGSGLTVNSAITGSAKSCWVFQYEA
jgi:Prophage antirepressor